MKTIKFFVVLITLSLFVSCGDSKGNDGDVTLTASLYGTVVDSKTGTPIPAAVVTVKSMILESISVQNSYGYQHWGHTYSAITGSDGRYEIPNIDKSDLSKYGYTAIEKYLVRITADGYVQHQSLSISGHPDSYADELSPRGWEYYSIVIDAGKNVQYDAALKKK